MEVTVTRDSLSVQLTPAELADAIAFGREIYAQSRQKQRVKKELTTMNAALASQLGAVGECAVAKALGVVWPKHIDTFTEADLPHNIEVRQQSYPHYKLRVRHHDAPARRVVSVIVPPDFGDGRYVIPGWINAVHGKKPEYLCDPNGDGRPLYLVPLKKTHGMSSLVRLIAAEARYP